MCEVDGCDEPSTGHAGLCRFHLRRQQQYGVTDWEPVPHYQAPGAPEFWLDVLRGFHDHGKLTGYCESLLAAQTPERYRRMPNREFWPLFARTFHLR